MTDDTLAAVTRLLAAGDAFDDLTGADLARCAMAAARDAQTVAEAVAAYRERAIHAMLAAGMTTGQVGEALGITKQRVSQLRLKRWRTGPVPVRRRPSPTAPPAGKGGSDVDIARHAAYLDAERETRGYFYRSGYRGRQDPMAHFFGPRFRRDLASEELAAWARERRFTGLRADGKPTRNETRETR